MPPKTALRHSRIRSVGTHSRHAAYGLSVTASNGDSAPSLTG